MHSPVPNRQHTIRVYPHPRDSREEHRLETLYARHIRFIDLHSGTLQDALTEEHEANVRLPDAALCFLVTHVTLLMTSHFATGLISHVLQNVVLPGCSQSSQHSSSPWRGTSTFSRSEMDDNIVTLCYDINNHNNINTCCMVSYISLYVSVNIISKFDDWYPSLYIVSSFVKLWKLCFFFLFVYPAVIDRNVRRIQGFPEMNM